MFKVQPLKPVVPFTASMFITSLFVAMYPFHFVSISLPEALKTYLPGVLVGTLVSGFAFWLGLGFSHRTPIVSKTISMVAAFYFISFMALKVLGTPVAWYTIFFTLVILFPLVLGTCWPAAWANNSFKADASGAA